MPAGLVLVTGAAAGFTSMLVIQSLSASVSYLPPDATGLFAAADEGNWLTGNAERRTVRHSKLWRRFGLLLAFC